MNLLRRVVVFLELFLFSSLCFYAFAEQPQSGQSDSGHQPKQRPVPVYDDPSSEKFSRLNELLAGYLQNDLELKKYVLTADSKSIDLKSTKIENGISVTLSSGEMKILMSQDKRRITVTPATTVEIPAANDTVIEAKIPLTVYDGESTVKDGSVSVTTGIITGARKQRKVNILESERKLLEAERNVNDRVLSAEKEFYETLKKLFNYAISVLKAKTDLFDDSVDLRVLVAQGYSKTSAAYRQANMKVASDRRDVVEKQLLFERETALFSKKCGFTLDRVSSESRDFEIIGDNAFNAAIAFLPDAIPAVKEENVFKYDKKSYSNLEIAEWNKHIAELKREADYDMTLKATGEYIFNDSFTNYDTVGGKLTWAWSGISASAGAYMPVKQNLLKSSSDGIKSDSPYFSLSLAIAFNTWRLRKLEKQQDVIDSQLEDIAIESAKSDYDTDILDKVSSFHDIKWSQGSYKEEFDMYSSLESDMETWLKQGIVTESEYLNAKNNREKARINILINAIEMLIYNDEIKLMFCSDTGKKS